MIRFVSALALAAGLFASLPVMAADPAPSPALSPAQEKAVEAVIARYLEAHPEAFGEMEARYKASQMQVAVNRLTQESRAPVSGNPKGDVTVVEFFDYNCGYCKHVAEDVDTVVKQDGNVRVIWAEFPILSESSFTAAKAALAAEAQGKYLAFHAAMMAHKGQLDDATIYKLAGDGGLDVERLKADMAKPEVEAAIKTNHEIGKSLDISGTPAFIIGSRVFPGAIPADALRKAIADARAAAKPAE